eukprot:GFYU01010633.1.p1 GENE.GFYU01010633.1~~GFYU01010633.1.p1  ORF type:complete len:346 (-),score=55.11 GFYU01010633.1:232-1269(-)
MKVLEMYSGVGGLRYAAKLSGFETPEWEWQSFDINTVANEVYKHNFGEATNDSDIMRLTPKKLDAHDAHMWLMSPPCQPYTRQGKRKDTEDPRAKSFLHLLQQLPKMKSPPEYLLLENVKGFDISDTRQLLLKTMEEMGYSYQEFLLSPTQFKIPNSRLRYFFLAKRKPFHRADATVDHTGIMKCIPGDSGCIPGDASVEEIERQCNRIEDYLELKAGDDGEEKYLVPDNILLKSGMLFDIVKTDDRRSCCFTKAYSRYVEGTGSVLQTVVDDSHTVQLDDATTLRPLKLRYFSEREISNIHGFPDDFTFPTSLTHRQCCMLLGNSLNVVVVCHLIRHLLRDQEE